MVRETWKGFRPKVVVYMPSACGQQKRALSTCPKTGLTPISGLSCIWQYGPVHLQGKYTLLAMNKRLDTWPCDLYGHMLISSGYWSWIAEGNKNRVHLMLQWFFISNRQIIMERCNPNPIMWSPRYIYLSFIQNRFPILEPYHIWIYTFPHGEDIKGCLRIHSFLYNSWMTNLANARLVRVVLTCLSPTYPTT